MGIALSVGAKHSDSFRTTVFVTTRQMLCPYVGYPTKTDCPNLLWPELSPSRKANGSGSNHPSFTIVVFNPDVALGSMIGIVLLRHRTT